MADERIDFDIVFRDMFSKTLGNAGKKINEVNKGLKDTSKLSERAGNTLSNLGKSMLAFASVGATFSLGKNIVMTTAKFQSLGNSIKFASDTAQQGEMSMMWISEMSKKYGLSLEATAEGFKTFQGAMMKTKFSSNETRKMFKQVSMGAVAMGLDAENTKGVFLALGQIMGKGKVQAEELRGQIGERIPGAFAIAARAMNMTTSELDKFMADGKLLAEDFLPKFSAEMEKTFGAGAEKNLNSLTATITRMENSWTNLLLAIGNSDSDGLMGSAFNRIANGLDVLAEKFMTIDQIARKKTNENTMGALGSFETTTKQMAEKMKAGGASKENIEKAINRETIRKQEAYNTRLSEITSQMKKMEDSFGIGKEIPWYELTAEDIIEGPKTKEDLFEKSPQYKKLYEELTQLNEVQKGRQGITDKIISDLFKTETVKLAPGGKGSKGTKSTSLAGEVDKIKSNQPSNININIDTLVKVDNIGISNASNPKSDMTNFLDQLESALLTVVKDVNYVLR